MADGNDIIRTADICDDHGDAVLICEIPFNDYAARNHFHGRVLTFATYEDNQGVRDVLGEGGKGKVLVVDGRGSRRRALCGGNIAAEAHGHGWEGLVFNGCLRDHHEFPELDFGLKPIGTTPQPPRHTHLPQRNGRWVRTSSRSRHRRARQFHQLRRQGVQDPYDR